ncbi:hypothetical protein NLX86_05970 [Streptomyces sp. A3M-1-3]|uniref:hypothetical protein n=1 Tax=Streptomyces sp. A3M-1-3 TaxID=2962044 RepID=UPI0020B8AB47|nr:hypothetical protein [Streptomyces sp. A3M-1-3]MCP3817695.1 hypothetical protein [Streptomyces sp. A3M-1-3]
MPLPRISDERLATVARWASDRQARSERSSAMEWLLGLSGRHIQDARLKADVLVAAAEAQLTRGRAPRHLTDACAAELACADALYREGATTAATRSLSKALLLAFHRVAQVDRLTSPLSDAPREFTAFLRDSATARAVAAPRGRSAPAAPRPAGRALRLLVVTHANANFLRLITERYEQHPDVELRYLDLASDPVLAPLAKGLQRMTELPLGSRAAYGAEVEAALRPYLDWADTAFVEWCAGAAAFLTLVDPGTTRVVLRLHRYETFTYWPHVMDFSRVDDLIFISEHMRELTTTVLPRLLEADAPRLHTMDNAVDLGRFARPKQAAARFTVGLVGIGQIAKDPRWALEVLRRLRAQDERYRLVDGRRRYEPGVQRGGQGVPRRAGAGGRRPRGIRCGQPARPE